MKRIIITLTLILTACLAAFAQTPGADEQAVLKLEEDFRAAKLANDVTTLARLVDDDLRDFNQFGQKIEKAAFLNLFKTFKQSALTISGLAVKQSGDIAIVSGRQREESTSNFGKPQFLLFTHVWAKRQGEWKLLLLQQQFDPTEGTVTPKGWLGGSNTYFLVGTDTTIKRGGTASAFIKSKHQEDRDIQSGLTQQIRADAYRGKRIRLTGYIRGQVELGQAFPWMRVDTEDGETLSFDNQLGVGFHPTPDWKQFQIVLDVPERSAVIFLGVQLAGRGRVWLDDWSLEVVGTDVRSTHQPPSEALLKQLEDRKSSPGWKQQIAAMKTRLPTLPSAPVNLDFESQ